MQTGGTMSEHLAPAGAGVLAAAVLVGYVRIMRDQGDAAPAWVVALFLVGITGALVGAVRPGTLPLVVSLAALGPLALLALATIGVLLLPSEVLLGVVLVRRLS